MPYPKGNHHNLLWCHFVFKVKIKNRCVEVQVEDGSKQVSSIDYTNIVSPVVNTYHCMHVFCVGAYNAPKILTICYCDCKHDPYCTLPSPLCIGSFRL